MRTIKDKVQRALAAGVGSSRGWGRKRMLMLRAEDVAPVVRIAHRVGALAVGERIIFDHELILVLAGRGEAVVGGERFAWGARDVIFLRPFVPHALVSHDPAGAHIAVHFDFAPGVPAWENDPERRRPYVVALARGIEVPRRVALPAGHRILHAFEEVLREWGEAGAGGDPIGRWAVRTLVGRILLYLVREGRRSEEGAARGDGRAAGHVQRLTRAADLARTRLAEAITPTEMARAAGMSGSRFNTLFARHTGYSPAEFVRVLRVERARELLADPDLTVKEVARRAGFVDAYHFSKVFRKIDGLSPTEYRAAAVRGRGTGAVIGNW